MNERICDLDYYTSGLRYFTEEQVKALIVELNEWVNRWNGTQKEICEDLWDNCAQEWCHMPCSAVLKVEKERKRDGIK